MEREKAQQALKAFPFLREHDLCPCHGGNLKDERTWSSTKAGENVFLSMSLGKPQGWQDMVINQGRRKHLSVHVMGETSRMTGHGHQPRQEKTSFCPCHGGKTSRMTGHGHESRQEKTSFCPCHGGNLKDDRTWSWIKTGEDIFLSMSWGKPQGWQDMVMNQDRRRHLSVHVMGETSRMTLHGHEPRQEKTSFCPCHGGNLKDDRTWSWIKTGEDIFLSMSWGKPQRWQDMNQDRRKRLSVHVMGETSRMTGHGHEPRQEKTSFCPCHGGNLKDDGTWSWAKTGENVFLSMSWGKPQGWQDMVMNQDRRKQFSVHVMGEITEMTLHGYEPRQEKAYFCLCHGGILKDDGTWS